MAGGFISGPNTFFIFLTLIFTSGLNAGVISLTVIVGLAYFGYAILLLVWLILPPKEDENKWGRNPLLPDTGLNDRMIK